MTHPKYNEHNRTRDSVLRIKVYTQPSESALLEQKG